MYPEAVASHLEFFSSDNSLISVSLKRKCDMLFRKGPKRFMFEHKWMMEEDFPLLMEQWMHYDNITDLPNLLFQFSGVLIGPDLASLIYLVKLNHYAKSSMNF